MRCFLIVIATIFSSVLFATSELVFSPTRGVLYGELELLKIGLNNKIYDDVKELASVLQKNEIKAKKIVFVDLDETILTYVQGGHTFVQRGDSYDSVAFNSRLVKRLRNILNNEMAYIIFVTNTRIDSYDIFDLLKLMFPDNFSKIPVVFFESVYPDIFLRDSRFIFEMALGDHKIYHILWALSILSPLIHNIDVVLIDDNKMVLEEFNKFFIGRTQDRSFTVERVLVYYPGVPKKEVGCFPFVETIVWRDGDSFRKVSKFLR